VGDTQYGHAYLVMSGADKHLCDYDIDQECSDVGLEDSTSASECHVFGLDE